MYAEARKKTKKERNQEEKYSGTVFQITFLACCHSLKILNNHFLGEMSHLFIKIKITVFIICKYVVYIYIIQNISYICMLYS